MCFFTDLILFLGRILFAFVFAYLGIDQLLHWNRSLEFFQDVPPTTASLLLVTGLILQFFGAFSLFFGVKTRLGALALLFYVIMMTMWPISPMALIQSGNEEALLRFLQHTLSIAGLLYVFGVGSGRWSYDWLSGCRTCCAGPCATNKKTPEQEPSAKEPPKT